MDNIEAMTVTAGELKTGDILSSTEGRVTGVRRWGNDNELVTISIGNEGRTATWHMDAKFDIQRDGQYPNAGHTRKINVQIEVWANDDGYPVTVEVTGEAVETLTKRALTELAQEGVNSQMGSYGHLQRAVYVEGRDINHAVFKVEDTTEEAKKRFPGNTQLPVVKNNWE